MSSDGSKFFDLIHGDGWRCLFTLPDRRHYFFPTSAELVAAAQHLDQKNLAVFHACATFASKKRSQDNVVALKCFWFDLDAGAGKPYADARGAYSALEGWRIRVEVPPALVVVSGGGLHVYWPLRDPLGVEQWLPRAHRLRALAQEHGLHIDPGSTIDAARILRPPGTHNRKLLDAAGKKLADVGGPPRPVVAGPLVGPYTLEEIFREEVVSHAGFGIAPEIGRSKTAESRGHNASPLAHGLGAVPLSSTFSPRPVVAGPLVGPYSLEEIFGASAPRSDQLFAPSFVSGPGSTEAGGAPVLASSDSLLTTAWRTDAVPSFLQGVSSDAGLLNIGHDDTPSDPAAIASRCGQFQHLQQACAEGKDPTPGWYPYMGVLAFCGEPGHAYARSLATDPHWLPTIEKKLAQWQEKTTGPTTCAKFGALHAGPCVLCPHQGKITSPIQLGRDLPPSVTAPAPPKLDLPLLPKGFFWKGQRLAVSRKPTDDDPSDHHVVSEYPVLVDELQEMERSKKVSLVYRSWEPMTQSWRDFAIGMGELVGQGGSAKVADHGVVIPKRRWDQFVLYTQSCANEHRGSRHYGVRYEQFGWKDRAFVLGTHRYRPGAAPERVHGSDEVARRGGLMAPSGTAAAWTAAADQLIGRPGMEAHAFMLLAAFAAPLYYFTGEPGATFVHGATRMSGQGKTTVLQAAASVFGALEATSIIERDTLIAKFVTLGTLCHLPVFFDELRFRDPEDTKHYVLQGTLGRDKQRGKAEGGLRTDHFNWATIHISASNLSLTDTVRHDGNEVAQAARIFEFSLTLPPGTKTTDGDALKTVLRANAGTAGRVFVQAVLDAYDWVAAAVPARMAQYEQALHAGPDERFVLRLLACVDVAGTLCRQHDILHVALDQVMAWAVGVQRGNAGRLAVESAVDAGAVVSQMVNDLVPGLLVMPRGQAVGKPQATMQPVREPKGELKARLEIDSRKLLVDIVAVRKWLQAHQYSFTEIQKELLSNGVLKDARVRRTLGAGSSYSIGQTWCWQIDGQHNLLADLIDTVAAPSSNVVVLRP